jgi:hypothetical protein
VGGDLASALRTALARQRVEQAIYDRALRNLTVAMVVTQAALSAAQEAIAMAEAALQNAFSEELGL